MGAWLRSYVSFGSMSVLGLLPPRLLPAVCEGVRALKSLRFVLHFPSECAMEARFPHGYVHAASPAADVVDKTKAAVPATATDRVNLASACELFPRVFVLNDE